MTNGRKYGSAPVLLAVLLDMIMLVRCWKDVFEDADKDGMIQEV